MRYFMILCLLALTACKPDHPVDSLYFRHCRSKCIRAGHHKARVVEDEQGYTCQCAPAPELEKT